MGTNTSASEEVGGSTPMQTSPPRENLIRASHDDGALTITRDSEAEMPVLRGHAAVFNQWTEINSAYEGRFLERIAPGAFAKTISEGRDRIKVLFQHGRDPQIGDKPLGPLRTIEEDDFGLRYEVPLLDTSYVRDLIPGLDAGLYGASFRFSVLQEDVNKKPRKSAYNPRGLAERTLTEVKMPELGPVTFGAYANATAGLRSLTDEFLMERLLEDEAMVERLAARVGDKQRVSVYFGGAAPTAVIGTTAEPVNVTEGAYKTIPFKITEGAIVAEPAERDETSLEPEPPEAATPAPPDSEPAPATRTEPEPPEATTRSHADLFWFADTSKLKGAT